GGAVLPWFDAEGHFAEPIRDWAQAFEDPALQAEARARLREAIDSLPPDYRTAFVLHDMEGIANPEIGELLGISLPAVKSRVHRSRLFLRQRLSGDFGRTAGPAPAPPGRARRGGARRARAHPGGRESCCPSSEPPSGAPADPCQPPSPRFTTGRTRTTRPARAAMPATPATSAHGERQPRSPAAAVRKIAGAIPSPVATQ